MPEHTIAENLQRLIDAKEDIADAITAKGGTVGANDGLEEFAADIATIPSGGGVEFSNSPANFSMADNTIINNLIIPNGITSIASAGCRNFTKLFSVEIPDTVTTIGNNAFGTCTSLESIKFHSIIPPVVTNSNAWANLPRTCKIYVPTGSLSAYTTASEYPSPNTYTYVEY